jgi:hypothetical protein
MVLHRGYRITVERGPFASWQVYASPTAPYLPILSVGAFTCQGAEGDALLEANRRIDDLLSRVAPNS